MLRRYYLLIVGLLGLLLASCGGMRRARQAPEKPTAVIVDTIAPRGHVVVVVIVCRCTRVPYGWRRPRVDGEDGEGESRTKDYYHRPGTYWVAGAGGDAIGWDYARRWREILTEEGIQRFERIEEAHLSWRVTQDLGLPPFDDIAFTIAMNKFPGRATLADPEWQAAAAPNMRRGLGVIRSETPPTEQGQLNLVGYSFGSVYQAQLALLLAREGCKIDHLVLVAAPISNNSPLIAELESLVTSGRIRRIVRHDIPGDELSNPASWSESNEIVRGALQNLDESGPHFDLARPDDPSTPGIDEQEVADGKIRELARELISLGVE